MSNYNSAPSILWECISNVFFVALQIKEQPLKYGPCAEETVPSAFEDLNLVVEALSNTTVLSRLNIVGDRPLVPAQGFNEAVKIAQAAVLRSGNSAIDLRHC